MTRKRSFDTSEVLDTIMIYFWRNGYKETGFRQLTTETGIQAQSLYNAFGSKQKLYYSALEHYVDVASQLAGEIVKKDEQNIEKLRQLLILDWEDLPYPPGCMVISSLSEFDQIDPKLNDVANRLFNNLTNNFKQVLSLMAADLTPNVSIESIANQLLTVHNGIQVAVRDDKYSVDIDDIVTTTIKLIMKAG